MVDAAITGADAISKKITELRAEASRFAGSRTPEERIQVRAQIEAKLREIDDYAAAAGFNGVNLLLNEEPVFGAEPLPPVPSPPPAQPPDFHMPIVSGGEGETIKVHDAGALPGTLTLRYEMYGVPDALELIYDGNVVASTGGPVSGNGSLTFAYPAAPSQQIQVRVLGPEGTAWNYSLSMEYPLQPVPPPPPLIEGPDGGSFTILRNPEGDRVRVEYRLMTAAGLGLDPFSFDPIEDGIEQLLAAEEATGRNLNYYASKSKAVDRAMRFGASIADATTTGRGYILDADLANEQAVHEAAKVRQELALRSLSIANQAPNVLLGLFK